MGAVSIPDPKIIIAIDGLSGCGKSTLAKDLSKQLSYLHIDSGAMYRSVALHLVREKISVDDIDSVIIALQSLEISTKLDNQLSIPYMNGERVDHLLQSSEVVNIVSEVAAIKEVRLFLRGIQQDLGKEKGIVMDGRDIGTVIFPDAELKLYITADIVARTNRRAIELDARGIKMSKEFIKNNLSKRDYIDSNRKASPLKKADDAIAIDTTNLTREEQLKQALQYVDDVKSRLMQ